MKKFNIKKWKEKQKKFFKKSKLNEQNIDPSQLANVDQFADLTPILTPTPVSSNSTGTHWSTQGFKKYNFSHYGGWLYQCSGGSYQEYLLTSDPSSTSNTIGFAVQNALYSLWATSSPYWSFTSADDITPADVMAYCILNPGTTLAGIKCNLALGAGSNNNSANDPACGGLWFGEYEDNNPISHNHRQITAGSGTTGNITGTTPSTSPLQSTYPNLIDAVYAHSPATGTVDQVNQYAMNNCIGPSGACDSSHYSFGCIEADQGAANYNISQNDPTEVDTLSNTYDATDWNTWTWLSGGEGLSGGWLDGTSIIGAGTYGGTNVEGCDPGTGIPNATNYDCCTYIGCNDTTTSTLNQNPTNYGVHTYDVTNTSWTSTVNTNYTGTSTPINLSTIAGLNNGASFGCESSITANLPDSTNKSCCAYVGCPNPNKPSVIYDGNNSSHIITDPTTWYCGNTTTPIAHPYAGQRIVGCDTAAMVADATGQTPPTGIPDPNDTTCCWDDPSGGNAGCNDPNAINGNASNDGCIPVGAGCPYGNTPVANDYSCCTYSGCPDFTDQLGVWDYSDSNTVGFKYTNQITGNGVSAGGYLVNASHGGGINYTTGTDSLTNPLKTNNGGMVIDNTGGICTLPNFGCKNDLASNYNALYAGCEGTGLRDDLYDNYTNPTQSTICCNFLGCPEPSADNYGPFNPSNTQYGNATTAVTNTWGLIGTTWTWLNGTPDIFGCDASSPYDDPINLNTSCCSITACTDSAATNYICSGTDWAIWCDGQGGNVTGNVTNGGCTYGGCKDSSITTTKVNDGAGGGIYAIITDHYQAANYDSDPSVLGCETNGVTSPTDYSCCVYYGCEDGGPGNVANNFIDPNSSSQFWPDNYDGTQTIVGCVAGGVNGANNALSYTNDDSSGNGTMDWTDPLSSWYPSDDHCCNYEGCSDTSAFNTFSQLSDSATGGGTELGIVGGLDSNGLVDELINICTYAGCNQALALNTSTLNLDQVGCEMPAVGGGTFIDVDDISCCEFIGCNEPDAYSYWPYNNTSLTSPGSGNSISFGGNVGCSADLVDPTTVDTMDDSCCEYIGCSDSNALNAGIHSNNNIDVALGPVIKYDNVATWDPSMPTSQKLYCSPDGTPGNLSTTSKCCCTYKEGCADTNAAGATPQSTGGGYDPDAGGCGAGGTCNPSYIAGVGQLNNQGLCVANGGTWTPSTPAACSNYTTYTVGGDSDIDGLLNQSNFPQWYDVNNPGSTVYHAYEELDPFNVDCCKYQTGCPDSGEWNPYCAEDQPGVWRILDDSMSGFGGTSGWWGTAGDHCDGGYGTLVQSYGYGAGWYEAGNLGCDVAAPLNQPDSIPGVNPLNPIPINDFEPCCTYGDCDPNWCCLGYNTSPILPIDNNIGISEQLGGATVATNPSVLQPASASPASSNYTSPWHPIPDGMNPAGGWSWQDLQTGHPCHCPDVYDPTNNPNGVIPVFCDDNQPIDPNHPCPLPPPVGCPPKFMPGKPNIMTHRAGTWNPDTCECDYVSMNVDDDDRTVNEGNKICCGNRETGEIITELIPPAVSQSPQSYLGLFSDYCEESLGAPWVVVRCLTTCDEPDTHTSLNPNWQSKDFKCGCRFQQTTVNTNAGAFSSFDASWNMPSSVAIPVGSPLQNYDPDAVGCEMTINHEVTYLSNYNSGAPNLTVPSDTDPESWDCCVPDFADYFGCMDPIADNYALNINLPNGNANNIQYGYNPVAMGCPGNTSNGFTFPDPNDKSCCDYTQNTGCADELASNHDPMALGCPINAATPNSPIVAFPNPHNASAAQPSDYNDPISWSCCSYADQIGCADPTASNYDTDHYGCDSDGDGLPNGSPFTNAASPNDDCCTYNPCTGCSINRLRNVCSQCIVFPYWDQCCQCCQQQSTNWCAGEGTIVASGNKVYQISGPYGWAGAPQVGQSVMLKINQSTWNNYAGLPIGVPPLLNWGIIMPDVGVQVSEVNNASAGGNLTGGNFKFPSISANSYVSWDPVLYWCEGPIGTTSGPSGPPSPPPQSGEDDDKFDFDSQEKSNSEFNLKRKMTMSPDTLSPQSYEYEDEDEDEDEFVQVDNTPEKTPEEIEYERLTAEYESKKSNLINQGWSEGILDSEEFDLDNFEFTSLTNQDNVKIEFYRIKPTEPTEPTEPTKPLDVRETKLTKKQLLKLVKKAINEVRSEIRKNK